MSETKRKVPKLRFPGFEGEWEQRKLDDIAQSKIGGGTPKTSNESFWNGDISWIQSSDLTEGDIKNIRINKYISSEAVESSSAKIIDKGAITLVTRVGVGKLAVVDRDFTTSQDFLSLSGFDDCNVDFIAYQLYRLMQEKAKVLQGTSIKGITKNELLDQEILIPLDIKEQESINQVLSCSDKLITLYQRKLENLKLKKKALLQKLFPKNGEQYPELRFPGFTDAWEQRKLSDFTERVVRKNGAESDRPLTISAQDGLVDQREYFNRQVASKDMSNYYLIKNGEFAYNKSYSEGYPFGAVKRLDYYESGALSTLYIVFKLIDTNVLSDFIVAYYMTHLWYGEISKRASEGARNHGLLNISPADFFQSEMLIPTNMNEQYLIGKFFESFDNLITLHQRKLEHLQLQKKALLQQMFV